MAFATQQNGLRTSVQSSRTAPFRSGTAPPRRVARVVTTATQEPVSDAAKKAAAAVVAATVALSPMSATAAGLGGILDQAGAAKDQAAGAVKSATGNTAGGNAQGLSGAIKDATASGKKGVETAPSIGEALENAAGNINPDAKRVAGSARQGAKDLQNQPNVGFWGNSSSLQVGVGAPSISGTIDDMKKAGKKGVETAPSIGEAAEKLAGNVNKDAKDVVGSARQGAKDVQNQPNVGFWGDAAALQTNVGLPSAGGLADKAKAAGDKVAGAAKDATGSASGPLQGAKGDAKSALGDAKQGVKDLKNQPNVGFWGDAAGLQRNVGLPSAGGLADKAKAAGDKVAGAAKDATGSASGPLQGAKGDAKSALGDAKQGVKNLKDQPNVGFSGDAAGLQRNVGLPSAGGLADKAKAAGDKVAGAAKDATGSASGPLQGAKGDAKSALGDAKQGVKDLKNQPNVGFWGNSSSLQVNVDAAYGGGGDKPASATDKSTGAAQDLTDQTAGPKSSQSGDAKTVEAAKQGVKNLKNQPMVGFNGRTDGLQTNVGLPSAGGLADKAKAAGDKVAGAAKDATGSASGPLQGAKGDAKSALGDAKQGVKNLKDQPNVGFWGDAAGLQKNIDFPVKLQDKAKANKEKVAEGNKSSSDGGQRAGSDALQGAFDSAKQGAEKLKKGVRFSGSAAGLQQNVDFPVKLQDKAKANKEKVAEGNKSSSDGGQRAGSDALQGAFDGAKQGAEKLKKGVRFSGSAAGLQQNVDFPVKLQDKAKANKEKVAEGNKSSSDGGQRAGSDALQGAFGNVKDAATGAKQAAKNQAGVAYSGASGLQVNVGLPSVDGLADKAKAAGDKVAGAAKDATGSASGPLQGAKGDAKSALGDAKQGVKDLKNQPNVAFDGSAAGLQKNVGQTVFGRGEAGTTKDQAFGAIEEAKDNVQNPVQSTKNALDRTGQEANRVLSNPTGGPEQSKRAAQQLSDANAEIPKALAGGAQKIKESVTSPASFSDFGTAALQRGAALEA